MQRTSKDISKKVSDLNPEFSLEVVQELNEFIFFKLKEKIKQGDSLIYFLPPLGNFNFRLKETTKVKKHQDNKKLEHKDPEIITVIDKVIINYKQYSQDKLNKKYERFGKENHESYILAKKQERLQRWQKNQSK